MGYDSVYSLNWEFYKGKEIQYSSCSHDKKENDKYCPECGMLNRKISLKEKIAEHIKKNQDINYAIYIDGTTNEQCEWYDFKKHMIKMSIEFQNVLFKLLRKGEENEDIIKYYFLNGGVQEEKAEINFHPFDEKKLVF